MMEDFPDHRFSKVEKVIEKVLKQHDLQELLYFSRISSHWKVIIGDPLYRKTLPLRLQRGVLDIGVPDSAYSNQLRYFVPNIIDLIASPEICGEGVVRKIVFKLTDIPKIPDSDSPPSIRKKNNDPLSRPEQQKIENACRNIGDTHLRKTFSRLMGKLMSK